MKMESAIYEPPRPEFPHLVVTFTPNGVDVVTAADRTEARTIISRLTGRKTAERSEKREVICGSDVSRLCLVTAAVVSAFIAKTA